MKVQIIDFNFFYSEKNTNLNNGIGIGAVSIITDNQMVTRLNEGQLDEKTNRVILGLGRHEQEKGLILSSIFNFHNGLYQNREGHYQALQSMSESEKKVLDEIIEIRYSNSTSGNLVTINIPNIGISNNEYLALEYLITNLEIVNEKLKEKINIWIGNSEESIKVENNYKKIIMPYLETKINEKFIQSVQDKNIIAKDLISNNNLKK